MNRYALALAGLLIVAAFAAVGVSAPASALPQTGAEAHWRERINEAGGKNAYIELAGSLKGATPEAEHIAAHAFGAALYAEAGSKGLAVCDSNFNFGCYHEFLGRAIAALGLSSVPSLNQDCVDALGEGALSCQHGIGHGILAYLGYDEKALYQGLAECRNLPYNDPIGGCYGGLFMEYNLQTMLNTEGRVRPLGNNAHAPCDSLDKEYRQACYYWQPQWWSHATTPPITGVNGFAKMGAWCAEAGENRRDCFEGLGNIASPESDFDPALAKELCESVSPESRYRLYCKSVAANSLTLGGSGRKGNGEAICEGLAGDDAVYCLSYARNLFNQASRPTE